MNNLKFYSSLRADLLAQITGVKNAKSSLFWDDTATNTSTELDLKRLQSKHLKRAQKLGIYVVTRHCDCQNKGHREVQGGYPTSSSSGLEILYPGTSSEKTENYLWTGQQLYQGDRHCLCPCSPQNKPSRHWVIDDVVYDEQVDTSINRDSLVEIFIDISQAIENSGSKKPRSGIREYLLKAILRINDQLLPIPMDEFVSRYCK